MVSNIFYFHPYLGKIPILTNIFQMGWNHQLENIFSGGVCCRGYRCVNWDHLHRRTRVDDNGGREFNGDITCQAFFGSWADNGVVFGWMLFFRRSLIPRCLMYIDLHVPWIWATCRQIYHTWSRWDRKWVSEMFFFSSATLPQEIQP